MTQPQTKATELIDRLNALKKNGVANDIALADIKRKAKELIDTDAYYAYIVLGMAACIEGNLEQTIANHRNALRLRDTAHANAQFSTSLNNLYQHDMALPYAEKAYRLAPDDLHILRLYIATAYYGFRFLTAKRLLADWNRRSPDEPYPNEAIIESAARFFMENGLDDDGAASIGKAFSEVVSQRKIVIETSRTAFLSDDGNAWLDRRYHIQGTVNDAVDLNIELAERVAKIAPPEAMLTIVARFTCSNAGHASTAH